MKAAKNKCKGKGCNECIRRRSPCDGTVPACRNCARASVQCSGYQEERAFTWFAPGRVSRLRDSRRITFESGTKDAPKQGGQWIMESGMSPSSSDTDDGDADHSAQEPATPDSTSSHIAKSPSPDTMAVGRYRDLAKKPGQRRLASLPVDVNPPDLNLFNLMEYWNNLLVPSISAKQLTAETRGDCLDIRALHNMRPSLVDALIATSFSYRITSVSLIHNLEIKPTKYGPTAQLWSGFYEYIASAAGALRQEISRHGDDDNASLTLVSMFAIGRLEGFLNYPLGKRAHAFGILSLIRQRGGIRTMMTAHPTSSAILKVLVVNLNIFNTTSPGYAQLEEACRYDTEDLRDLYEVPCAVDFWYPTPLFLDMVHINNLRLPSTHDATYTICDILSDIDAFCPREWLLSRDLPKNKDFLLITYIFKSSMALFGSLTVPCKAPFHAGLSCNHRGQINHDSLFYLLMEAYSMPIRIDHIFWPILVAGVAAKTEQERQLVEQYFLTAVQDPFTGSSPRRAMVLLRKFWASGKTNWDDCFDQPYSLGISYQITRGPFTFQPDE
ncbi:Phomenoic acid biosynthesis cluster-specific transcriptional regulator-like protein [Cladobotryum mycophilum]|uniref:Phomenoic acid biosynthesis cluster-specific transcriptional regulator-like protein n=1 Tax=Cladobotryum mycophilum TaxID=491253 RepID=A0ABR0SFW5_9HYPO